MRHEPYDCWDRSGHWEPSGDAWARFPASSCPMPCSHSSRREARAFGTFMRIMVTTLSIPDRSAAAVEFALTSAVTSVASVEEIGTSAALEFVIREALTSAVALTSFAFDPIVTAKEATLSTGCDVAASSVSLPDTTVQLYLGHFATLVVGHSCIFAEHARKSAS